MKIISVWEKIPWKSMGSINYLVTHSSNDVLLYSAEDMYSKCIQVWNNLRVS